MRDVSHQSPVLWNRVRDGVLIIAEIGKHFIQTEEEQSTAQYLSNARTLIELAKTAGADVVKFQTHNLEDEQLDTRITSPHFPGGDRYRWLSRNDAITTPAFWQEIARFCDELEIPFLSTPMSRGAAIKLNTVGMPLWKVGSGDILDFVMLDYLAETGKPIILSSGMSTLEEVDRSIDFLTSRGCRIALLHCVSKYPCPPEQMRLGTIGFFRQRYGIPIGFSDHSLGHEAAVAAVARGATIIEKHFSLSRSLWGPDHKVSLTPHEFGEMVDHVRNARPADHDAGGEEVKLLADDEVALRPVFRKSLVAGQDIAQGRVITKEMIYAMRPQQHINGLPSESYELVLGKRAARNLKKYEPLDLTSVGAADAPRSAAS